jgi:anti-sigma regulatory factor (Ser/Thr protein kinase)
MILASPQRHADRISKPLTLGAIAASPGTVRTAARSLLIEWGLIELTDSVELIASELVTNAVQVSAEYTVPPPVEFRMSATGKTVLIEVWDYDPRQPVIRRSARLDEGGRGLVLVATVSARWGWTTFQEGKIVWAEVR